MQKILLTFIVMLVLNFQPKTYEPTVVLELFTSQGCSSCPAADKLLNDVKQQYPDNVIPLSYHVDYWNYIGWKDPFSSKSSTNKQRDYNTKFSTGSNYTPQAVVNGQEHFVGSREKTLNSKIKDYLNKKSSNKIELTSMKKDNQMLYNYSIDGSISNKSLKIILVIEERTTSIKSGENRNRTLHNANIVINQKHIELKHTSGTGTIEIPKLVETNDNLRLVALIQTSSLDITGATQVKL